VAQVLKSDALNADAERICAPNSATNASASAADDRARLPIVNRRGNK
jgi:hypothetical protein